VKTTKRASLTPDRISDAALELIEEVGLESFSMRGLAARLGVEPMSLYHHVPNKAHLLDAVLARICAELTVPADDRPWRDRVRDACLDYRAVCLRYPRFAQWFLVHRMNTPPALAYIEKLVQLFFAEGFGAEESARSFRLMGYYMMGAVLDETAGYANGPTAAEPVPLSEQKRIAPGLIAIAPFFQEAEREATFVRGLDLLLDGFERRRKKPPPKKRR
jgi:AcrR family transcriptional regulator